MVKRIVGNNLTEDEKDFLTMGWCLDGSHQVRWPTGEISPFANKEAARKAWHAHRKEILASTAPGELIWAKRKFRKKVKNND